MASSDSWPRIPGYELLKQVGAGGMGSVYIAKRQGRSEVCAVKVLKSELMGSPLVVRRFEKEIEVLMLQRHPGIVQLLDAGRAWDGRLYLSTRYLPGQDMFRVIHRVGPMPPPSWLQVALQFLDALAGAHELAGEDRRSLRLIHRDIKPENVVLGYDGGLTILDFGLASVRLDDERSRLTRIGQVMGTPKYMAPEQIMDPESVSAATDVFSAAVTLTVSAAGRTTGSDLPNGDDKLPLGELWARLSNPDWPLLSRLAPQLPPDFDPVFRKALAVDQDERFSTARGFAEALRAAAPFAAAPRERLGTLIQSCFEKERIEIESWLAQHAAPEPVAEATQAASTRPRICLSNEPGTAVTELASRPEKKSIPAAPEPRGRGRTWVWTAAAVALLSAGGAGLLDQMRSTPVPAASASAPRPTVRPVPNATPRPSLALKPPRAGRLPDEAEPDPDEESRARPAPIRRRRPPPTRPDPPPTPPRARTESQEMSLQDARRKDVLGAWRRFDALLAAEMDPQLRTLKALELLREVAPLDPDDPCGRRALYASTLEDYAGRCRPR